MKRQKDLGLTLLEVMIAIGIFGILMLAITMMLRAEIGLFNTENVQNQNEQRARVAISSVVDQVRLNGYVYYSPGSDGYDNGFYTREPGNEKCLVNLNPDPGGDHSTTEMLYYPQDARLWYKDADSGNSYLLAELITTLEVEEVTPNLARIRVEAGNYASDIAFELVTWVRMY